MRLIVCGSAPRRTRSGSTAPRSRGWSDDGLLRRTLDDVRTWATGGLTLIEGEAEGADLMARRWAEDNGVTVEPFAADWKRHGRGAGPIRNQKMLASGADHVVAFSLHWPPIGGTGGMCALANEAGVPVHVVTPDGQRRPYVAAESSR